jgi:hypothetical protein
MVGSQRVAQRTLYVMKRAESADRGRLTAYPETIRSRSPVLGSWKLHFVLADCGRRTRTQAVLEE